MAQFKVGDRVKVKIGEGTNTTTDCINNEKYEGVGTVKEVDYKLGNCLIKFDDGRVWMHGRNENGISHDEWYVCLDDIELVKEAKSRLAERFVELLALAVSREGSNELREEVMEFKYRLIEKGLVTYKEIDNALMSYLNNEAFNKKIEEEMRGE